VAAKAYNTRFATSAKTPKLLQRLLPADGGSYFRFAKVHQTFIFVTSVSARIGFKRRRLQTAKTLGAIIMKKILIFGLILLTACNIGLDFSNNDLKYMNWAESTPTLKFTSNKKDTIIVIISSSEHRNTENYIETGYSNVRKYEYQIIRKDTNYYAEFFEMRKPQGYPATQTILFEGCIGDMTQQRFNNKLELKLKEHLSYFNDVAIFDVMHHNYGYFTNEKRQLRKVWWSYSKGLLKYTTADSTIWTRIK
jgi:hypothetical protein